MKHRQAKKNAKMESQGLREDVGWNPAAAGFHVVPAEAFRVYEGPFYNPPPMKCVGPGLFDKFEEIRRAHMTPAERLEWETREVLEEKPQ
ncbi:MAG: hypothetical protein WC824_13960 [Bacteroidota bacterium]|jgi:hypothetical protein